jgi:exodeoxyribonuclease V alpha subunit
MAFTIRKATAKTKFNQKNEDKTNLKKFKCLVNKFIYKDEESGFFVFLAELSIHESNPFIEIGGKRFISRKFPVVGTSIIMTQTVVEHQEVEIWGNFEEDKDGRIQFVASAIQEVIPTKPKAIEIFLSSGKIYGIGKSTAKKIVNQFGSETIKILDKNPEALLEIPNINAKKLELIKNSWEEWRSIYEIVATMRLYGIGDAAGIKIFNKFKEKSIEIITTNPYQLTEISGIGFVIADKIARQIGISPVDPQRIEKCIFYILEEVAEKGNTAYPKEDLIYNVYEILQIDQDLIKKQIDLLIKNEVLISKKVKVTKLKSAYNKDYESIIQDGIAHKKMHNAEITIAKELKRILDYKIDENIAENKNKVERFLESNPYNLDNSQLKAVRNILNNKVSILTGGPGTGKTYTIKSLLKYFDSIEKNIVITSDYNYGQNTYISVLSAPTGRAAKRMEESTGKSSSTIHRLLGFKDGKFLFNEQNKLKGDIFILDESSMIDIWLMSAFLKALPNEARLIIVGDTNQLPSVGAGNVLKDMIESKLIPVSRLEEIHRQALNSNIIVAAYDIINKKIPKLYDIDSNSDFVFVEANGNEEIQNQIIAIITNLINKGVKAEEIQILSPRKDTSVGTQSLNEILRPILNENYLQNQEASTKFVQGDRVMQFKNNRELDIYNGDIGKVTLVEEDSDLINVNFDGKDIEFKGSEIKTLNLSYAITLHKSQGSDYPYVIIPMSKSHTFMWDANLLYTGVTRGKKRVILVGEKKTLAFSVANFKQNTRITGLKEQILEAFGQTTEVKEEQILKDFSKEENVIHQVLKKPSPFDILKLSPFKK